ncbi:uncharacterized protein LOC144347817 [Saccoglossus kowalevskii]
MVHRVMAKHPVALYEKNENVLVKLKPKTKLSSKNKSQIFDGKIIDYNDDTHMYKIEFKLEKKSITRWFALSDITSLTRSKEREKRSKDPIRCKCKKSCMKIASRKCTYEMNKLCCKRTVKQVPCTIKQHNHAKQIWNTCMAKGTFSDLGDKKSNEKNKNQSEQTYDTDMFLKELELALNRVESHEERLLQRVEAEGFSVRNPILGDGNCFFRSIEDQLERFEFLEIRDYKLLRQQVVQYMIDHPLTEDGINRKHQIVGNWRQYIKKMKKDGTWADHVCVQATSEMLKIPIHIVTSASPESDKFDIIFSPKNCIPNCKLLLGHISENHYISLDVAEVNLEKVASEKVIKNSNNSSGDTQKEMNSSTDYSHKYDLRVCPPKKRFSQSWLQYEASKIENKVERLI